MTPSYIKEAINSLEYNSQWACADAVKDLQESHDKLVLAQKTPYDANLGRKTIVWHKIAHDAITKAGGSIELLDKIPLDLLEIFVRNNIHLTFVPEKK